MKKLFTLAALFCLALSVNAQDMPINAETGKVSYSEVVPVEGSTKDALYLQAQEWFVKTFNDANAVLQIQDKEQGVISGKGFTKFYMGAVPKNLWYTAKVEVKDGRYRYEVTDLYLQDYPTQYNNYSNEKAPIEPIVITNLNDKKGKPRKMNLAYKEGSIKAISDLTASLKASIKPKQKTDW